jgi:dTMP kinase
MPPSHLDITDPITTLPHDLLDSQLETDTVIPKSPGRLVVFEGVDATGKTTLSDDLCTALEGRQLPVRRFHFPGKSPGTLGELVYRVHCHHADAFAISSIDPCALQLLHIAAHVDTIEAAIKPCLAAGYWVVLDRFWWSTYVYGIASGVSAQALEHMIAVEKAAWGNVLPSVLILVDTPKPLRQDEPDCAAWHRKRELYTQLLGKEQALYRCHIIGTHAGATTRGQASETILREVLRQDHLTSKAI